jgi:ACS family tartrate transporter-like MFS transporter
MMLNGAHSDHADERPLHVAVPLLMSGAGFFGCAVFRQPILAVFFLALVPIGHCSAYGPFWSMPSRFLSGAPAAAGIALVVTIANVGGLVGPTIIGMLLGGFAIVAALLAMGLRRVAVLRVPQASSFVEGLNS